jgi:hypothetical protein
MRRTMQDVITPLDQSVGDEFGSCPEIGVLV